MRDPQNISDLDSIVTPDYLGLIFYKGSKRYVNEPSVPETKAKKTGVFVNEIPGVIEQTIERYDLSAIQLHGDESPEQCSRLRQKAFVIKALGIKDDFDFNSLGQYIGKVDAFLFDTFTQDHGGSGKTFNWTLLEKYNYDIPFFLSGGISMDHIGELKKIEHPFMMGVDINSRFETAPGLKNIALIKKFKDELQGR